MPLHLGRRSALRLGLLSLAASGATGCSTGSGEAGLPLDVSEVPVGGGCVMRDAPYVVTQPKKGEYHAFQKFCTHAGCPVSHVDRSGIVCTCHNSVFSSTDGSVVSGPARKPLAGAKARASAQKVYLSA